MLQYRSVFELGPRFITKHPTERDGSRPIVPCLDMVTWGMNIQIYQLLTCNDLHISVLATPDHLTFRQGNSKRINDDAKKTV